SAMPRWEWTTVITVTTARNVLTTTTRITRSQTGACSARESFWSTSARRSCPLRRSSYVISATQPSQDQRRRDRPDDREHGPEQDGEVPARVPDPRLHKLVETSVLYRVRVHERLVRDVVDVPSHVDTVVPIRFERPQAPLVLTDTRIDIGHSQNS